ncbi:MAG: PDZ domain-containing protein [Mariniblastus sp.]|nr:PDZ domain-containing protein [Mariniblastus sp.]
MKITASLPTLLATFVLLIGPSVGQDFKIDSLQEQIYSTIDHVLPSVVAISSGGSTFSGVVISSDGHVLSAGHAINPGDSYRVLFSDGRRLRAKGLGANGRHDCALLQIENISGLPYSEMGDSTRLKTHQPCLSISHPGGYDRARGAVIRFGHIVRPLTSGSGMVQSTALMEPGDSGGALFDLNGNVIAIHSRIGRSMDRNYDVPINKFREYWDDLNEQNSLAISRVPGLPKLGFRCENVEDKDTVVVLTVQAGGISEKAGLRVNDVIASIDDSEVKSTNRIRKALIEARDRGATKVKIGIQRGEQISELTLPYLNSTESEGLETANRLTDKGFSKPIPELKNLSNQFGELESKLDDQCVTITSRSGDKQLSIRGTLVADSHLIVSKNSRVGEKPVAKIAGKNIELKIVAKDTSNDLVLLRRPSKNATGVRWDKEPVKKNSLGRFLITPNPNGQGRVSVWSSPVFQSRKRVSKGYLGVILSTNDNQGAVLEEIDQGAARDAGLEEGDVIIKMDSTIIKGRSDLLRFLSKTDPNNLVKVKVRRGQQEIEKSIALGDPPADSGHVADRMERSGRRDGFTKVFSHDADLQPEECGGPLYDWQGNLIGLNIARNSRVRSYAIPTSVVRAFIQNNK